MIRQNLCDFSDAYIPIKGIITIPDTSKQGTIANNRNVKVILKNGAPFINCTIQVNNTQVDGAYDLYVAIPIYNLIEYSDTYSKSSRGLCQFYGNKPAIIDFPVDNNSCISFKFKEQITGQTQNNDEKNIEIMIPLNHISHFLRTLEMPLINCEISPMLICSSILIASTIENQVPTFTIIDAKIYVLVVTLSTKDNVKLLKQLESCYKLLLLTDLSFQGVNRLLVFSFDDRTIRQSYKKYLLPTVEITDYNVLIDERKFCDQLVKSNLIIYDHIKKIAIGQGDDYTVGCLLNYPYFKNYYKPIAINLSKHRNQIVI